MIATKEILTTEYNVDIGRPDLIRDIDFKFWRNIHNHIKSVNYDIYVNSFFYDIESYLERNAKFMGGGMSYCFWFDTEDDKKSFINYVKGWTE